MKNNNKFTPTSIQDLQSVINPNSIVGNPIVINENLTVIPVIKNTALYLGGGGEYGEVKQIKSEKSMPFAGGSGAVVSLKPSGFLIDQGKGVQILSVADDAFSRIIESVDNFIKSFKNEDK